MKTSLLIVLFCFVFPPAVHVGISVHNDIDCTQHGMKQDTLEITGRIFVGGNEPFTVLAVEKEDGTAIVLLEDTPLYRELYRYQGSVVKLRGVVQPDPVHGKTLRVFSFEPVDPGNTHTCGSNL